MAYRWGTVLAVCAVALLWLPSFEVAMQPDVTNFTYYIHGQVDFRPITRIA